MDITDCSDFNVTLITFASDTNGVNLNRCYTNPDSKLHPSIFATKKVGFLVILTLAGALST